MNISLPMTQEGSALFRNNVTAIGNFINAIAVNSGGRLQPFNPSGKAPHSKRRETSLCRSLTSDSMRSSKGTQEASHSIAIPLDGSFAVVPRYKNRSSFHSRFLDASFTRNSIVRGEKVQIRVSPSTVKKQSTGCEKLRKTQVKVDSFLAIHSRRICPKFFFVFLAIQQNTNLPSKSATALSQMNPPSPNVLLIWTKV